MISRDKTINILCDKGYSLRQISKNTNLKYETIRSICKRNGFKYKRCPKGRPLEAYDKTQRARRTKPKSIYGSHENNVSTDIDKFLQTTYQKVNTKITTENAHNFK